MRPTDQEGAKRLRRAERCLRCPVSCSEAAHAWPAGGACEKEPRGTLLPCTHLPGTTGPILWSSSQPDLRGGKPAALGGHALHNAQQHPCSEFYQRSQWAPMKYTERSV